MNEKSRGHSKKRRQNNKIKKFYRNLYFNELANLNIVIILIVFVEKIWNEKSLWNL